MLIVKGYYLNVTTCVVLRLIRCEEQIEELKSELEVSEVKCSDLLASNAEMEQLNARCTQKNVNLLSEIDHLKVICCPVLCSIRGGSKGSGGHDTPSQRSAAPPSSEIFGECNWQFGMKIY